MDDYFIYAKKHELSTDDNYQIATCYYEVENYVESKNYFVKAYQMDENNGTKLKIVGAYNIGAINALLGNIDESIKWLKIPIEDDKKRWLTKIKEDKDFDVIRGNKQFVEFLRQQEQSE